jgi:hypothetical protein
MNRATRRGNRAPERSQAVAQRGRGQPGWHPCRLVVWLRADQGSVIALPAATSIPDGGWRGAYAGLGRCWKRAGWSSTRCNACRGSGASAAAIAQQLEALVPPGPVGPRCIPTPHVVGATPRVSIYEPPAIRVPLGCKAVPRSAAGATRLAGSGWTVAVRFPEDTGAAEARRGFWAEVPLFPAYGCYAQRS